MSTQTSQWREKLAMENTHKYTHTPSIDLSARTSTATNGMELHCIRGVRPNLRPLRRSKRNALPYHTAGRRRIQRRKHKHTRTHARTYTSLARGTNGPSCWHRRVCSIAVWSLVYAYTYPAPCLASQTQQISPLLSPTARPAGRRDASLQLCRARICVCVHTDSVSVTNKREGRQAERERKQSGRQTTERIDASFRALQ